MNCFLIEDFGSIFVKFEKYFDKIYQYKECLFLKKILPFF